MTCTHSLQKWRSALRNNITDDEISSFMRNQDERHDTVTSGCAKIRPRLPRTPPNNNKILDVNAEIENMKKTTYYQLTSEALGKTKMEFAGSESDWCRLPQGARDGDKNLLRYQPQDFFQLFVNDDLGILYCSVPKVACTQWKRILIALSGKINVTRLEDISHDDVHGGLSSKLTRRLSSYTPDEICYRLQAYFKFMFIREPMERLLSAFRDKFLDKTHQIDAKFTILRHQITRRFRLTNETHFHQPRDQLLFDEFISYVIHSAAQNGKNHETGKQLNRHWRPMNELCHPCAIDYNFIGKYETLEKDSKFLLKALWSHINHAMTFPKYDSTRARTSEMLVSSFANVTLIKKRLLYLIYKKDYDLFRYKYPFM